MRLGRTGQPRGARRYVHAMKRPVVSAIAASTHEQPSTFLHEALLNLAFDGGPPWRLLCPYDVSSLPPAVLQEAARNHPFLVRNGRPRKSAAYGGLRSASKPFDLWLVTNLCDLVQIRSVPTGSVVRLHVSAR